VIVRERLPVTWVVESGYFRHCRSNYVSRSLSNGLIFPFTLCRIFESFPPCSCENFGIFLRTCSAFIALYICVLILWCSSPDYSVTRTALLTSYWTRDWDIILNSIRQHSHFITQANYKATFFDYRLVILRPIFVNCVTRCYARFRIPSCLHPWNNNNNNNNKVHRSS